MDSGLKAQQKKVWTLQNFEGFRSLGVGSFGLVYRVREKESHIPLAMKVLFKAQIRATLMMEQVRREIEIHMQLNHPNIIALYGFFQDKFRIFIIMELAEYGSLASAIQQQPLQRFDELISAKFILSVVSALIYLHEKNIIHRDLKLENILIGKNHELKFCDFGLSVKEDLSLRKTICGTAGCMAPEVILNKGYDRRVDLWSLGVFCFELMTGKTPFFGPHQKDIFDKILKLEYVMPDFLSAGAQSLIRRLLVIDPAKRVDLKDVQKDEWVLRSSEAKEREVGRSKEF